MLRDLWLNGPLAITVLALVVFLIVCVAVIAWLWWLHRNRLRS